MQLVQSVTATIALSLDSATFFEVVTRSVPAQRASHKSAQGNALGLGISSTKSPNGADLYFTRCRLR